MSLVAWAVAAICFAGGFAAALMARRHVGVPTFAFPAVWLLSVLAFGLTLPTQPAPTFHPGGALGWGVLLASGLWMIGAFVAVRTRLDWLGATLPLMAPVLALAFAPREPMPALWGVGIATVLVWILLKRVWQALAEVALGVLALIFATGLAIYADAPRWYGVCVAGAGVAALWVTAWLARQKPTSWWLAHALLFGAFTVTALGYHLAGVEGRWLHLVLMTLIAVTLARGFASAGEWMRYALLVWVALFASVFTLQRGFGLAVVALMASLYAMVMAHTRMVLTDSSERALYTVGAVLLVFLGAFRLFVLSYPLRVPRADLYTHYTLVGFLLALVGLGVLALWWRRGEAAPLGRTLVAGFWAAGLPLLLGALFTERATAGWLAGALAAALSAFLYAPLSTEETKYPTTAWLYPLAFAGVITALAFTDRVVPYADLTRQTRLSIVLGAGVLLALSLLLTFWMERRASRVKV
ncbi:MAG: hypothetical protein ABDI19_10670 [Armatimonadota bacterium]